MNRILTAALLLLTLAAPALYADDVTIDVFVDSLETNTYHLLGQSAFVQYRTGGSTGGGQIDGVSTPGTSINFTEVFPPPSLADYLRFAYFGIVERRNIDNDVLDTSLVIAYQPGVAEGQTLASLFPALAYTQAQIVTALTTVNDSDEFFALGSAIDAELNAQGTIGVPPINQFGDTLDLIAFWGLNNTGLKIGTLDVTVVPEPASLALLAAGSLLILRRRRAA